MQKNILITGSGEGIGYHIAEYFLQIGYHVILSDISLEKAENAVKKLNSPNTKAFKLDVSQEDDFQEIIRIINEKYKKIDVLINNAGLTKTTPISDIDSKEYIEITANNQLGTFLACQKIGALMVNQGFGRIINLSSLAGQNGGVAVGAHYAASEGAIITITKLFAKQYAAHGVTVNAIACGPVDSPAFHRLVHSEEIPDIIDAIPVKQLGNMEFIAQTIALLAQENSAFVTGATWDMNGGLNMR